MRKFLVIALLLISVPSWAQGVPGPGSGALPWVAAAGGDDCAGGEKLGWDTLESTNATLGTGSGLVFGTFTASCTGTLATAHVYLDADGGTAGGSLGVFQDLSGATGSCGATDGAPDDTCDTLVAKSDHIVGDTADAWYSSAFASGSVTKGAKYWLVFYNDQVGGVRLRNGNDTASHFADYDSSCDGYQNVISEVTYAGGCSFPTDDTKQYSMYVTLGAP